MSSLDIFIFAGEKSADLHGNELISELKKNHPSLQIAAVSGSLMRKHDIQEVMPMENFEVIGFVDVFFALSKIIKHFFFLKKWILKNNPKVLVFIDYPGFNLRLEKSLKKAGFSGKIIHFVCPTVWAWGKGRIPQMAKTLDLLLTIFPFEKKCFAKTDLTVEYVGNPLVSKVEKHTYPPKPNDKHVTIGIFPGSRRKEIERNLPLQLKVLTLLLKKNPDLHAIISVANSPLMPIVETLTDDCRNSFGSRVLISANHPYNVMQSINQAIATSGTITLELALHKVPTVVTYAIKPLDLFIIRKILRINLPFYCIVNIIAEKEIFPELYGPNFTEAATFKHLKQFLDNPKLYQNCVDGCISLKDLLINKKSKSAAMHVLDLLPH